MNYTSADAAPPDRPAKYRPVRSSVEAADRIGAVLDDTGADRPPARRAKHDAHVQEYRARESSGWNWASFDLGLEIEARPAEVVAPAAGAPWAPGAPGGE